VFEPSLLIDRAFSIANHYFWHNLEIETTVIFRVSSDCSRSGGMAVQLEIAEKA
jgi:hypothetical protein